MSSTGAASDIDAVLEAGPRTSVTAPVRRIGAPLLASRRAAWGGIELEANRVGPAPPHEVAFLQPRHALFLTVRQEARRAVARVGDRRPLAIIPRPGHLCFVAAGHPMHAVHPEGHRGADYVAVFVEPAELDRLAEAGPERGRLGERSLPSFEDERIRQAVMALREEAEAPGAYGRLYADAAGLMLLTLLARRWAAGAAPPAPAARGGLAPWQLRRVTEYLEANLARDVSLAELAAVAHLSPGHLCTAFRRSTGLPPHRFLVERRVERAKALLADGRLSVTDVALASGFGSSAHFATAFRRLTGATPSAWRRERSG